MLELEALKEIIKEKDLSQEKLARALGVSLNTVIRWFQNKSKPSDLAMIQIRKFIGEYKKEEKMKAKVLALGSSGENYECS